MKPDLASPRRAWGIGSALLIVLGKNRLFLARLIAYRLPGGLHKSQQAADDSLCLCQTLPGNVHLFRLIGRGWAMSVSFWMV